VDLDEDCVIYKEFCDMMKAMTELLTKNQTSTTTTSPSTTSYYILPVTPCVTVLLITFIRGLIIHQVPWLIKS
jgi:hypothetical protein